MGALVNFISRPVLSGFASAAAILTTVSVSKDLFGVTVPSGLAYTSLVPFWLTLLAGHDVFENVSNIAQALPTANVMATVFGIMAIVGIVLLKIVPKYFERLKRLQRVPGE